MLYESAVFMATPYDWPEDYAEENGYYCNICFKCRHQFTGHKRRVACKVCSNNELTPPRSRAVSREQREPEPITNLRKMLDTALQWAHSTYGNSLEDVTYLLTAYDDCRAQLAAAEQRAESLELQNHILTEVNRRFDVACIELRTRAERAEQRVAELERDGERLDAIRDNAWTLTPFDMPTGGGDSDIGWAVTEMHAGKSEPVQVGIVYEDDPRKAIDTTRDGQGA